MSKEAAFEARMAAVAASPVSVKRAVLFATLVGVANLARSLSAASLGKMSTGMALVMGGIMLAIFWFNGFALYGRNRGAFIFLIIISFLPLWGLITTLVQVPQLLSGGMPESGFKGILNIGLAGAQILLTGGLFYFLFAGSTCKYVFDPDDTESSGSAPPSEAPKA